MRLRVKLMGALKAKAPAGGTLELPEDATIAAVLEALNIDSNSVHIVIVNNKPQGDRSHALSADDELTILPPVGGG